MLSGLPEMTLDNDKVSTSQVYSHPELRLFWLTALPLPAAYGSFSLCNVSLQSSMNVIGVVWCSCGQVKEKEGGACLIN